MYKKFYIGRYNFIKNKYGVVKNEKLIFRFNRYSKRAYIIKLLKDDFHVILDTGETYKSVADNILQKSDIKNYKKYINNIYIEKFFSNLFRKEDCKVDVKKFDAKKDNSNIFGENMCFFPPCLKQVSGDNCCSNHQDKKYDF